MSTEKEKIGGSIFEAIPKVIKDIGAIGKNGKNMQQKYKFRSIDDIYNGINPAFSKTWYFAVPTITERIEEKGKTAKGGTQYRVVLYVDWTFFASDGTSVVVKAVGEALDYSDKATNKALTQSFKYSVIPMFAIALEDNKDDADAHSPEAEPK